MRSNLLLLFPSLYCPYPLSFLSSPSQPYTGSDPSSKVRVTGRPPARGIQHEGGGEGSEAVRGGEAARGDS
jgi:hypothetical protein